MLCGFQMQLDAKSLNLQMQYDAIMSLEDNTIVVVHRLIAWYSGYYV